MQGNRIKVSLKSSVIRVSFRCQWQLLSSSVQTTFSQFGDASKAFVTEHSLFYGQAFILKAFGWQSLVCNKQQSWFVSHIGPATKTGAMQQGFICMLFCHLKIQSGVLTLKPPLIWCVWKMLKDALKVKKCLISSLTLEGYHRLAFTLQDQKPLFSFHWWNVLLKLIYEWKLK